MQDLHHASASVQGRRPYNEDRSHSLHPLLSPNSPSDPSPPSFFAVFDGHGGEAAVEYVTSHLSSVLTSLPSYASLSSRPQALEEAFLACDAALRSPTAPSIGQSGTTCGCVLIDSDRIVSANCGDTRTVLVTSDSPHPIDLTVDHKPTDDSERRRIEAAGGKVTVNEIPIARNGKKTTITQAYVELGEAGLAVSRAFGDLSFKADGGRGVDEQVVVVRPHVQVRERSVGDEFLVLASDGLWNFVPVDAIVDFVRGRLAADDGERGRGGHRM